MALKCWFAGARRPFEYTHTDIVFANSHKEARKTVWARRWQTQEECGFEFTSLKLYRKPEHDQLATGSEPYVVTDRETLRGLGWQCEGDNRCGSCGLAEWDGKYPVCQECSQCIECGCLDDCESAKQGGSNE